MYLTIYPQAIVQWNFTNESLTRQRWQYICPKEPYENHSHDQAHFPAAENKPWNWAHELNIQQREVTYMSDMESKCQRLRLCAELA